MQFYANRAESGRFRAFRAERQSRNNSTSQFAFKKFAIVPDCMQLYLWPLPWKPIFFMKYKKKPPYLVVFFGAVSGIWTRDLVLTKDVLYLLSHNSIFNFCRILRAFGLPVFRPDIPYQGCALPTEPQQHLTVLLSFVRSWFLPCYSLPRTCSTCWAIAAYLILSNG